MDINIYVSIYVYISNDYKVHVCIKHSSKQNLTLPFLLNYVCQTV